MKGEFALALLVFGVMGVPLQGGEGKAAKKAAVTAADGMKIVYESRGSGDTALIFLHGWCGDRHWFKHQLEAFADDYRVIGVDQAGHGESGKGRKQWSVQGLAQDVETLVKHLGVKRVILVGHSMGGPVALAAAKRLPGTVVAVIGVDTLHNAEFEWPEADAKKFLEGLKSDFKGSLRGALKGMLPEKVDPELLEWITSRAELQRPSIAMGLMSDMARLDEKVLLREAKVPVRCINAGLTFKFAIPTETKKNRKYADFNAVILEDVGHFPMLEQPQTFNRKLRDVLKEFPGSK